jgi:hypothetical protein
VRACGGALMDAAREQARLAGLCYRVSLPIAWPLRAALCT